MPQSAMPRGPWPSDFPDVVIHTTVRRRDAHPEYAAAKAGDANAALALAIDLIEAEAVASLGRLIDRRDALLLPVIADEDKGFNAIPDAMAQVLGRDLDLSAISGEIVQANKVGHTRARTFQRIVTPAEFDGEVVRGADYVLVDDHVGIGGTLANLRGYVERHGGHIIAMTTLTENREGRRISLRAETQAMLEAKHGKALDQLWRRNFGYGLDCLTETEAQNLRRQPSVAAIEDFLAQAAVEARRRGLEAAVGDEG